MNIRFFILFLFSVLFTHTSFAQIYNKEESLKAFEYLNLFRKSPKEEAKKINLKLKSIKPAQPLIWNETLARIAKERAMDMAENNYFSHRDKKGRAINYKLKKGGYEIHKFYTKDKRLNSFESISAGMPTGAESIASLIIDEGVKSKGHRKHLLGIDYKRGYPQNSTLYDCGIAFVDASDSNARYQSYVVVIIAKHEY